MAYVVLSMGNDMILMVHIFAFLSHGELSAPFTSPEASY